jgi:hypothetical protein
MVRRLHAWNSELPEDPIEATQAMRSRSRSTSPGRRTIFSSRSRSRSTSMGRRTTRSSRSRSRSQWRRHPSGEVNPSQGFGIGDGSGDAYGKGDTGSTAGQSDSTQVPPSDLQPMERQVEVLPSRIRSREMCNCSMRCYHPIERGHEPFCLYCDPLHCPEGCCCPCAMCYPDTDSTRPQDLLPAAGHSRCPSLSPSPSSSSSPSAFTHRIWTQSDIVKRLPPQGFAKRFERARVAARLSHLRSDWRIWSWCPGDSQHDEASLPLHRFHHPPPAPLRAPKPKPIFQPRVVPILVPENARVKTPLIWQRCRSCKRR